MAKIQQVVQGVGMVASEFQEQNKIPSVCRGMRAEQSRQHPVPGDHRDLLLFIPPLQPTWNGTKHFLECYFGMTFPKSREFALHT